MAGIQETPRGNRIHIAFFGLRNAGKSTLVNALTGQSLAIVSPVAGTTTDPVSKAMEILPLGPCLVTDTAGLDDVGELGKMRVEKTLGVLATTDVAIWVHGEESSLSPEYSRFVEACRARRVPVLEYHRGDSVDELKKRIAAVRLDDVQPEILEGVVRTGDRVICVCPIDESAPKGRLILPQVQVLRSCLDRRLVCSVCQPQELAECLRVMLAGLSGHLVVITDSQAFASVSATVRACGNAAVHLTSFSILFARQKGDVEVYRRGIEAVSRLKDGDRVLVAEGCTHHRQCNDIGTTKIPKALAKLTENKKLVFEFASGTEFRLSGQALVVQCGGCMLTRREVMRRIEMCEAAKIPIVNYGMLLATAAGALP